MREFTHSLIWLPTCSCVSLILQIDTASDSLLQQNAPKDSLKIQIESNYKPFKLLPKFNQEKDSAGFKFIPKHSEDAGPNDPDFIPYDKPPQIVKKVDPIYPEAGKLARVEGKVIVKIWVDKEGKAAQVVVLKSSAEIFNEPAIAAAKQFVFTPAYMNNKPVAVWVSFPFEFRLPEKK